MLRQSLILVLTLLAVPMTIGAAGEVVEEWVARYDGPASGSDVARALAVGADGSVHVTGRRWAGDAGARFALIGARCSDPRYVPLTTASPLYQTSADYVTIKYDSQGNELWVAVYDGLAETYTIDDAQAIVVGVDGSVHVTGYSGKSSDDRYGETWDFATIKYDSDGNEQWVARYDGPAEGKDEAVAIAVDEIGNVYVTGLSRGVETLDDFATIKYDPDGEEEWVARYDGPVSNYDWVRGIAVDDSGNVYVTGSTATDNHYDFVTIRYNPDGEEAWVETYTSPGAWWDEARAIALDATGNVYVTGRSWGGSETGWTHHDYLTIKYLQDGTLDWHARYAGPGPADDFDLAYDVVVDEQGNAFVTGVSVGVWTGYDFATIKYGPDGTEEWVARFDSGGMGTHRSDVAYAAALSGDGGVCVTGVTGTGGRSNFKTIGYSALGDEEWVHTYNAPADSGDYAWDIAVGPEQNVYVCGASYDDVSASDCTTIKYAATTGFQPQGDSVDAVQLLPCMPNPFVTETLMGFSVPVGAGRVRLTIHNARGQLVRALLDGSAPAGRSEVLWDGRDEAGEELASGVYLARIEAEEQSAVLKMVLLK